MLYISSKSVTLIVQFNLPSVFQIQEMENAVYHLLYVRLKRCVWIKILCI